MVMGTRDAWEGLWRCPSLSPGGCWEGLYLTWNFLEEAIYIPEETSFFARMTEPEAACVGGPGGEGSL